MSAPPPQKFDKNHILFREDAPAKDFYILMSGKLAVFRHRRFVRAISGRGVFVGEMGTLLGDTRSATIITLEPATLIVIPKSIDKVFLENPEIGVKLIDSIRHRLSETYDRAEKVWEKVFLELAEIMAYEVATKASVRKSLSFSEMEKERIESRKMVMTELTSERFDFSNLIQLLKRWDIEAEYKRNLKATYPMFKYVDLNKMKDLWKKRTPESPADQLPHCIDLARGLNELTDFLTSFGIHDEDTGSEEIDMLETSIPLAKRIATLKAVSQNKLTPKLGIDKMKVINRDIDTEVEEANRVESKTGRVHQLSEFARKIEIGKDFLEELRKEFWDVCMKGKGN